MILKKRALKAYQNQLDIHPLPKPRPINLPVVATKEKEGSFDSPNSEPENPYDKWYMTEPKVKKVNPAYIRYRNMVIVDTAFKVVVGLVLIGLIVNIILL